MAVNTNGYAYPFEHYYLDYDAMRELPLDDADDVAQTEAKMAASDWSLLGREITVRYRFNVPLKRPTQQIPRLKEVCGMVTLFKRTGEESVEPIQCAADIPPFAVDFERSERNHGFMVVTVYCLRDYVPMVRDCLFDLKVTRGPEPKTPLSTGKTYVIKAVNSMLAPGMYMGQNRMSEL